MHFLAITKQISPQHKLIYFIFFPPKNFRLMIILTQPTLLLFKLLPLLKVLSPLSTMPKMSSVTLSTATATPNRQNLNKETLMEM
jgi:hypothetical protein